MYALVLLFHAIMPALVYIKYKIRGDGRSIPFGTRQLTFCLAYNFSLDYNIIYIIAYITLLDIRNSIISCIAVTFLYTIWLIVYYTKQLDEQTLYGLSLQNSATLNAILKELE